MRNILAIARKELNVYFTTPIAYVVFCAMTFVTSYVFINLVQGFAQLSMLATQMPDRIDPSRINLTDLVMVRLIGFCSTLLALAVPFISMRLMAEEKSGRTFELLMTTPLRPTEIVLGKFLGGLVVIFVLLGLTFSYPLVLQHYGASAGNGAPVEWGTILSGYGGLLIFGAMFLAVGLFISSLTESQIVAAIISLAFNILIILLATAASAVDNPTGKEILTYLAATEHLGGLLRGEIAVKDILYFLSAILLGLFLTQRAIESQRWA